MLLVFKGSLRDKSVCENTFIPQEPTRIAAGNAHCVF